MQLRTGFDTAFGLPFDGLRTQLRMLPFTLITGDSFAPPCTNYDAEWGLGQETFAQRESSG
jgi:hypothetical protein